MYLINWAVLYLSLVLVSCGETPTSNLSEQFPILRSGPYDMDFAFIPSGTFRMGSPEDEEGRRDNETLHWVKLTEDYWMQTTEVTMSQWHKIMGEYPSNTGEECRWSDDMIKEDTYPVVCVSWIDVIEFIAKLNRKEKATGYSYALPTESQWEYAARGFTEGRYSGVGPLNSLAWYKEISDKYPHPVGKKKNNLFGLYDVHGNVSELVSDWYVKDYPRAEFFHNAVKDPKGPNEIPNGPDLLRFEEREGDPSRIVRGGAWSSSIQECRAANRITINKSGHSTYKSVGLRLLRRSK